MQTPNTEKVVPTPKKLVRLYTMAIKEHIKINGCFCFGVDIRYEKLKHKKEIKKIVERLYYLDDKTIEAIECTTVEQVVNLINFCKESKDTDLLDMIKLNLLGKGSEKVDLYD